MAINLVVIEGNLTADAEVSYRPNGTPLTKFRIAHNETVKGEKKTYFWNCSSFSKYVEKCASSMKKGVRVTIVGKAQVNNYTNKQGVEVEKTEYLVTDVSVARTQQQESSQQESSPQLSASDIPF